MNGGYASLGEQTSSSLYALKKANQYSFDTAGIVMSYGTKNEVSAEAIGEEFVREIKKRGYPPGTILTMLNGMAWRCHFVLVIRRLVFGIASTPHHR